MSKIAILTDSCSDIPQHFLKEFNIYQIPLIINYEKGSYRDRIDISPEEVYENLKIEIPHTSLPSVGEVYDIIENIIADGYDHIIAPVISSGLSGAYNVVKTVCNEYKNLKSAVIDTKNIGIGSGFYSLYAAKLIEKNLNFDEIVKELGYKINSSHVFFSLKTLHYLIKGGRIGRVEGTLGSILKINPIISCDNTGVYHTVEKVRGRNQSINKLIEIVKGRINTRNKYYFAICHGYAQEEADHIREIMQPYINKSKLYIEGQISPALGVHTGPGLIGIGYFNLEG
jgi:DegV family protein with EDD domain